MTVQVPDLKDRTGSEAASEAKARGLEATVKDLVYDEQIEKAKVASQSPAAGTQVRIGHTIELTLSMGKKPTEKTDSDGE